ncbi:WAT1-related protein At5g40230-like isoform X3 [Euphorbia lathyris]|uniref:WAT1-related protein At5g40230-like isoform X3 n=1 Tax=Euphorbia lathyris TaxID=212925 RepID=UPI003313F6BC
MATKSSLSRMLPFAAMVTLECLDTGINTLGKAAMSEGISHFVLVVYSNALATLIMFFTSFICNNRANRPPLTYSILCKFFLLSLAGITITQNCVFTGISYTSPTLASAIGQLVPAFTFILAVIFRMEKLDLRSSRRKFKVVGTLVSMLGALIVIFYKGPPVSSINFSSDQSGSSSSMFVTAKYSWVIGGLFITISSVSLSVFIIFQAVFGNVVTYGVATWCIHKKGPVFVAMFKPLGIAISVLISVMFLGDTVYFGSVIGATIIVVGFYCVIYSQSNEDEQNEVISIVKEPLLASQMAYYQGLSVER